MPVLVVDREKLSANIDKIIEELAEFNKTSIEKVAKLWKIGNVYIPKLVYIVLFDSFNCGDGFVEKVILLNKTINKVMDTYAEKQFPNEKIIIRPQIEIQIGSLCYIQPPPPPKFDVCLDTLLYLEE